MVAKYFMTSRQWAVFDAMYGCKDPSDMMVIMSSVFAQMVQPGVDRVIRCSHALDRRKVRRRTLEVAGMTRREAHRYLAAQGAKRASENEGDRSERGVTTEESNQFWSEQARHWKAQGPIVPMITINRDFPSLSVLMAQRACNDRQS